MSKVDQIDSASTIPPVAGRIDDFETTVRSAIPAVRRFAIRLTGNQADSDDLVQETLLRAWKARDVFQPGSNMKAWLTRIARNCYLSGLRRSRRQVSLEPEMLEIRMVAVPQQESGLLMAELAKAKQTLGPSQRAALKLVVDEGLSYDEAALRMGIPVGTVKSQVARARTHLMRTLAGTAPLHSIPQVSVQELPASAVGCGTSIYAAWKNSNSRMIGVARAA